MLTTKRNNRPMIVYAHPHLFRKVVAVSTTSAPRKTWHIPENSTRRWHVKFTLIHRSQQIEIARQKSSDYIIHATVFSFFLGQIIKRWKIPTNIDIQRNHE